MNKKKHWRTHGLQLWRSLSSPRHQHLSDVVLCFLHAAFKVDLLLLENKRDTSAGGRHLAPCTLFNVIYLQFFHFLISCLLCVCQVIVDFLLRPENEPKGHKLGCHLCSPRHNTNLVVLETHMRPTPSYSRVLSGKEAISVCVSRACF